MGELESRAAFLARQARRQHDLAARGVAPATRMEETENDAQVARERVNVVRQRLTRLLTTLKGDPDLPVDQHPTVHERIAERDRAELDLARTTIRAPVGGTVVNMRLQRGEQVRAATPVFALVSERRPWVEANLKETTLTNVTVGQRVEVVLDIYPDVTWQGEVESISPATGAEIRDPPSAERLRQLGEGGAAPAGTHPPGAACGGARSARRHHGVGFHRHRPAAAPGRGLHEPRQPAPRHCQCRRQVAIRRGQSVMAH